MRECATDQTDTRLVVSIRAPLPDPGVFDGTTWRCAFGLIGSRIRIFGRNATQLRSGFWEAGRKLDLALAAMFYTSLQRFNMLSELTLRAL